MTDTNDLVLEVKNGLESFGAANSNNPEKTYYLLNFVNNLNQLYNNHSLDKETYRYFKAVFIKMKDSKSPLVTLRQFIESFNKIGLTGREKNYLLDFDLGSILDCKILCKRHLDTYDKSDAVYKRFTSNEFLIDRIEVILNFLEGEIVGLESCSTESRNIFYNNLYNCERIILFLSNRGLDIKDYAKKFYHISKKALNKSKRFYIETGFMECLLGIEVKHIYLTPGKETESRLNRTSNWVDNLEVSKEEKIRMHCIIRDIASNYGKYFTKFENLILSYRFNKLDDVLGYSEDVIKYATYFSKSILDCFSRKSLIKFIIEYADIAKDSKESGVVDPKENYNIILESCLELLVDYGVITDNMMSNILDVLRG